MFIEKINKLFKIRERGSTVKIELIAGLTTFVTMSYILAVNPAILSITGMPAGSVFTATIIASVIAMLIMAFAANLPIALSSSMGLNTFFAYTVCLKMGYPYQLALTAVFCEGVLFVLLSLMNVREAIVHAIPLSLKAGIAAGIGLFIAFIGLQGSGIVVSDPNTLVTLGDLKSPATLLSLCGLLMCLFLYARKIKGSFLITMLILTLIGIPLGQTNLPENFSPISIPDKPLFFDFEWHRIFSFDFFVVFFTFLFIDLFDTVGTFIAIATQSKIIRPDGSIPRIKQAFLSDAFGTITGSVLGTSTVSSFAESAAGVAEGGKTGLTTLTTAACFAMALLFSPIFLLVPPIATAPVLILVGFLMAQSLKEVDFLNVEQGLPAFLALVIMPMTYSIAEGIVFGILSQTACMIATKRTREISKLMWALTAIFLIWMFLR